MVPKVNPGGPEPPRDPTITTSAQASIARSPSRRTVIRSSSARMP